MRIAQAGIRSIWALFLALVLAPRLLTPAGFMPAFDHGAVTIIACPDADGGSAPREHHHGGPKKLHQPCPYAAASSPGALSADVAFLPAVLVIGMALLLGRASLFLEKSRAHERPPLRGPPLPA